MKWEMSHKGRNTLWPHPINRTTPPITILLGLFPWNYMKRKRHGAWCMVPCPCSHSPAYPTPPTQTILPVNGICKPKSYQRHHAFFAFFGSLFFPFLWWYIYIYLPGSHRNKYPPSNLYLNHGSWSDTFEKCNSSSPTRALDIVAGRILAKPKCCNI